MESLQRSVYRHIGDLSYKRKAKKLVSETSSKNSPPYLSNNNLGLNYQMNPCYLYDPNQNLTDKINYNFNNININNQKFETKEEDNDYIKSDNNTHNSSNNKINNVSSSKRLTSFISKPAVQSKKVSNSITKIFGLKKHDKMVNEIDNINSFSNIAEDENINNISSKINDKNNNDQIVLSSINIEDDCQEKEKVLTKFQKLKKGLNVVDPRKVKPNAKKNEYKECLILSDEE
ncbi:Hypothetical protein SRAE_X000136700 [Strongyloides ratti]|uniref:Uncharacterized protein n=1 Tax=Strongyloides ratti TaxID=34506 RepID=A0A090MNH7_STRRB|nr:Hypothetical protein SRAE_X000136700 [Strongyloides ratti]CEF59621.1 Hypothetical protein SRAE_X000136700 [Strongyloides ratti]